MTIPASQWASAWADHPSTTEQQAALAEADLERWIAGAPHAAFDPFRKLLTPILPHFLTFLEVGSGWGGYCQVLKHIDASKHYNGCDISEHMVDHANEKYGPMFWVADSANLPDKDKRYDVVCISGLIQHLADYRPSIREAVRVSNRFVMLHRIEATNGLDYEFIRRAYDSDVPTRKVNQLKLSQFCLDELGLKAIGHETWSSDGNNWSASWMYEKT